MQVEVPAEEEAPKEYHHSKIETEVPESTANCHLELEGDLAAELVGENSARSCCFPG